MGTNVLAGEKMKCESENCGKKAMIAGYCLCHYRQIYCTKDTVKKENNLILIATFDRKNDRF